MRHFKAEEVTAEYRNHETDDHGFPLCTCDACREKSKIINDQDFAKALRGVLFGGHDEHAEHEDREQDYPFGDMK